MLDLCLFISWLSSLESGVFMAHAWPWLSHRATRPELASSPVEACSPAGGQHYLITVRGVNRFLPNTYLFVSHWSFTRKLYRVYTVLRHVKKKYLLKSKKGRTVGFPWHLGSPLVGDKGKFWLVVVTTVCLVYLSWIFFNSCVAWTKKNSPLWRVVVLQLYFTAERVVRSDLNSQRFYWWHHSIVNIRASM